MARVLSARRGDVIAMHEQLRLTRPTGDSQDHQVRPLTVPGKQIKLVAASEGQVRQEDALLAPKQPFRLRLRPQAHNVQAAHSPQQIRRRSSEENTAKDEEFKPLDVEKPKTSYRKPPSRKESAVASLNFESPESNSGAAKEAAPAGRKHQKSRQDFYLYPKRLPVPEEKVSWEQRFEEYTPPTYDSKLVRANCRGLATGHHWADPEDYESIKDEIKKRVTLVCGAVQTVGEAIRFDFSGCPMNPYGRTGLRGRGVLGRWGPNHTADIVISTFSHGKQWILAVQRQDAGDWTIPTGMVFDSNSKSSLLLRLCKLPQEEHELPVVYPPLFSAPTDISADVEEEFNTLLSELVEGGRVVKSGYVDDPTNTDNAWVENTVYFFHCDARLAKLLDFSQEPGNRTAWLQPDNVKMDNRQKRYIKRALQPKAARI